MACDPIRLIAPNRLVDRPAARAAGPRAGSRALAAILVLAVLALGACAPAEDGAADGEAPAPEPTRVENEDLGIAVVDPPGGTFEIESNQPGEIRLSYDGDENLSPGTVIIAAEPEQEYGVNLYDAVNARKAELEAREGGHFEGQNELGSHLGTAFSTRGGYTADDGESVEEIKIYAVHPTANRLLHLTYRYQPAPGQSRAEAPTRLQEHAMVALGYIEPLAGEGTEAEGGGAGAAGGPAPSADDAGASDDGGTSG